jgi:hypothetical protein
MLHDKGIDARVLAGGYSGYLQSTRPNEQS